MTLVLSSIVKMTCTFSTFAGKLCIRKQPERGCLRKTEIKAPKDCTPILQLPSEVRAVIFKYLVDDSDLLFKFDKSFNSSSCWARWPEYHRNLSFLRVCKKFEAEGLALVQVESISMEVDPPPDPNLITAEPKKQELISMLKRSKPQPIALRLDNVRPHLKQLTIDARYTLSYLLDTDLLDSFPKLRSVRIRQTLWSREFEYGYRDKLKNSATQQALVKESVGESNGNFNQRFSLYRAFRCRYDNVKLGELLANSKLAAFLPIEVDVTIRGGCRNNGEPSEDAPTYPVNKAISALRFSYTWPSRTVKRVEVDMYNQPMALAIKSEWTETVSPVNPRKVENKEVVVNGETNNG